MGVLFARPLAQGAAAVADPGGQGVAQPLQLAEVEDPGRRRRRRDAVLDRNAAEALPDESRQLALEGGDLAPELAASRKLVDPGVKRRETGS